MRFYYNLCKRFLICLGVAILFVTQMLCLPVYAQSSEPEGAVINIVYDDSGSMTDGDVTTWSQAKYALEIFTAMMRDNDTINVFPMSEYDGGMSEDPQYYKTLDGSESPQKRVDRIETLNGYGSTPFAAVESAGNVLKKADASDKWLIILTDGIFNSIADSYVQNILNGYQENGIKIVFIAIDTPNPYADMDNSATSDNPSFAAYATNSSDILQTVTEVAQRIFSLQQIELSGTDPYAFQADIPLSKLIILAQGEHAEVKDLKMDGNTVSVKPETVDVDVLQDTPYKPKSYSIVAPGLEGVVEIYKAQDEEHPMANGNYSFQANGKSVQAFFEPGIRIQAFLNAGEGQGDTDILNIGDLQPSDSELNLKIINPLTGDEIEQENSVLLQGADISLQVTDDQGNSTVYKNGDQIHFEPGEIQMEATATFPSKVKKSTGSKTVKVNHRQPLVTFTSNGYSISANDLSMEPPVKFTVSNMDESNMSKEELEKLQISITNTPGLTWDIQPENSYGDYMAIPSFSDDSGAAAIETGSMSLQVEVVTQDSNAYPYQTDLVVNKDIPVDLELQVTTPAADIEKDGKNWMFDSSVLGIQPDAPYLTVFVQAKNPDGSLRPLSEVEWDAGLNGFSFKGTQINPGWLSILRILGQSIDFAAEKGDELSSYRLYLGGPMKTRVLPGDLELQIDLSFLSQAGFPEEGQTETEISVMPQGFWTYLGTLIIVLTLLILLIVFITLTVTQKKIPLGFVPTSMLYYSELWNGFKANVLPVELECDIQRNVWKPWKPQTAEFSVRLNDIGVPGGNVTVKVEAAGNHRFFIKNLDEINGQAPRIFVANQSITKLKEKEKHRELSVSNHMEFADGKPSKERWIIVKFGKPDQARQKGRQRRRRQRRNRSRR